jgi:NAD(P)-dependent dehydrogenase (short-subunit alcohol dehydrogenase family)
VQLDVTDQQSVDSAVALIEREDGALDVLVNNAGIAGRRTPVPETTVEQLRDVYETNVFGVARVIQAFTPLLLRSEHPVVVNVSSGMGSIAVTTDPARLESGLIGLAYPSSKTAVNMLTSQYAKAYPQMRINAVDPGYTATDLNRHRGTQSIEEGAEAIVRAALLGPGGPTGGFFDAAGAVPW